MGESINIMEYIDIFKKRKKIIFIILLIFMIAGGLLQYRNYESYVPTYKSTVSVRINTNKNTPSETSDKKDPNQTYVYDSSLQSSALNQSISEKYYSLAVSKRAITELINTLGLQGTYESISNSITVAPQENIMEFIDITVVNTNPQLAQQIANTIPTTFNNELKRVIGLDCVEVLYDATEPSVVPRGIDNTFRNFTIIGLALAIFVVLLLECLDNKVITPDDAEKYWGAPVIGVLPFEKLNAKGKRIKKAKDKNIKIEEGKAYKNLRRDGDGIIDSKV